MKRILSVVCALALMLCAFPLGIVSAAAGTQEDPIEIQAYDTIESDGSTDTFNPMYYVYNAPNAGEYTVTITGSLGVDSFGVIMEHPMTGMAQEIWAVNGELVLTATAQMWMMNQIVLPIFDMEVQTLTITIDAAKGTWGTPDTLVIGENVAKNPDNDYYYYTWTAEEAGTLTITMPEENWAYNGYVTDPETLVPVYFADLDMTSADEVVVNPFTVDVKAGDEVSLMVQTLPDAENWGAVCAGEVAFTVAFDVPTGAQDDPIPVRNGNTVTVGAGETKYFVFTDIPGVAYKFNVTGATGFMVGTAHPMMGFMMEAPDVDGVYAGQLVTGNRMSMTPGQATFTITNTTEEAQEYALSIVLPVGTMENPEELMLGETTFVSEDGQTYYYTWTALEEGNFTFMINTDACTAGWYYAILHNGELLAEHTSNDGCNCSDYAIDVFMGDAVQILVNNYDYVPGETVVFTTEFYAPVGTENNPIPVEDGESVTVDAGATTYFVYSNVPGAMFDFTVTGATGFMVGTAHPMTGMMMDNPDVDGVYAAQLMTGAMWSMTPGQAIFSITNNTEEAQEYALSFVQPVGTMENPAELVLGETTFVNEDGQSYYYTWTAEQDGTFTLMVNEELCTAGWEYTIVKGEDFVAHTSGEEVRVPDYAIDVVAGDELKIIVNNFDWAIGETMVFTTTFEAPIGTEGNPIPVEDGDNVTVEAGTTMYFVYSNVPGAMFNFTVSGATGFMVGMAHPMTGMMMDNPDVDGVYAAQLMTGAMWSMTPGQAIFSITNNTEEAQEYALSFVQPVGTLENPAELVLGETTFVNEDGQSYYYTWTAEQDGTFTLTVNEELCTAGWEYTVVKGEDFVAHTSGEEELTPSYEIAVAAGDEVKVIVNNFDWAIGETMVFTTSFVPAQGSGDEPMLGDINGDGKIDIADATLIFRSVNGRVILTDAEEAVADVNDDGQINIADATMVFRYVNGRITTFE